LHGWHERLKHGEKFNASCRPHKKELLNRHKAEKWRFSSEENLVFLSGTAFSHTLSFLPLFLSLSLSLASLIR
jgi:hypothetical protein